MYKSITKLLGCLILLCTAITANAQFRIFKNVTEIEILGGASLVSFRKVEFKEFNKIKIGLNIGGGINFPINNKFSISPKLLFERKGINREEEGRYFDESSQTFKIGISESFWNFNYLSLPVSFRYSLRNGLFFEAGPFISYLLKAQVITTYSYNNTKILSSQKDSFLDYDWGAITAFGYSMPLNKNLKLDARIHCSYGFIDISNYPENTAFQVAKTISIGVLVALSRKCLKTSQPTKAK